MKINTIPFSDITKQLVVEVRLTGLKIGKLRFSCAALIFRLGAFVAGTGITITIEVDKNDN